MSTALAQIKPNSEVIEQVIIQGDLAKLQPFERVLYYKTVCDSLGVNPHTKPFEYITLNGKLTLYARKDLTDQLRQKRKISVQIVSREKLEDLYIVTARATAPDGRFDEAIGVVTLSNQRGDQLANSLMKAETKAKRRVTLSICGLGWTDESEIETIPTARNITVNEQGEILDNPARITKKEKYLLRLNELIAEARKLGFSDQDIAEINDRIEQFTSEDKEAELALVGKHLAESIKRAKEALEAQKAQPVEELI